MKFVDNLKKYFGMAPPDENDYLDDYVEDPGYAEEYGDRYGDKYSDYGYQEGEYDDYGNPPGATPLPPLHSRDRYGDESSRYAPREAKQITTVSPKSYAEAELIGKRFREGNPVVVDLSRLDTALGQRLIDFSSGLVFAMDGSLERIARKVFLLSPAETVVNDEDRRRLENNYGH
ncbi:MAG: cell division protein SepF [Lawsonella sp.]|nr:cell division protein SepF [Mycobacteriales bacterium]